MTPVSYGVCGPPVNNDRTPGALPPWPELIALIDHHDGYDKITAEAWAAHDDAIARWRAARVARLQVEQAKNLNRFRSARVKKAVRA